MSLTKTIILVTPQPIVCALTRMARNKGINKGGRDVEKMEGNSILFLSSSEYHPKSRVQKVGE